jgi:hypothetical protein
LNERTHILAKLCRHEESIDIFVSKLNNLKAAQAYCERYYRKNDPHSEYLFTTLFNLQHKEGVKNITDTLKFMNCHGYRMDAEFVICIYAGPGVDGKLTVSESDQFIFAPECEECDVFKVSGNHKAKSV